jgi:hypothetical protein
MPFFFNQTEVSTAPRGAERSLWFIFFPPCKDLLDVNAIFQTNSRHSFDLCQINPVIFDLIDNFYLNELQTVEAVHPFVKMYALVALWRPRHPHFQPHLAHLTQQPLGDLRALRAGSENSQRNPARLRVAHYGEKGIGTSQPLRLSNKAPIFSS